MARVSIDDSLVDTITELAPGEVEGRKHFGDGLQSVVLQALMRKGAPDPQTGALARSYLIEGVMLRDTLPDPDHGLDGEWRAGIVAVDVRGLALVNDRLGMEAGEKLLAIVAEGLRAFANDRPIVRIHGDAFAVLYLPPDPHDLDDGSAATLETQLVSRAREQVPELDAQGIAPAFTVGASDLVIDRPSHWRILGPLVWAEAERAHHAVRNRAVLGLQRRRILLDGYVG